MRNGRDVMPCVRPRVFKGVFNYRRADLFFKTRFFWTILRGSLRASLNEVSLFDDIGIAD